MSVEAVTLSQETCVLYRKISRHILPLTALVYFFYALDIVNLSFAKLQLQRDIGISEAAYGFGASLIFIGYLLFDIPASRIFLKIGARKTLSRVMVLYGLLSVMLLWVSGARTFALLRFLLGVFEAGGVAGTMAYLSRWMPSSRLAQTLALFSCAPSIAGIISGPLSTWVMTHLAGAARLAGWQWLFLLQGLCGIGLGLWILFKLEDTPASAKWLSDDEKTIVAAGLEQRREALDPTSFFQAFKNPNLYGLALIDCCLTCGGYIVMLWLPTLLREAGAAGLRSIGLLSVIPPLVSFVMKMTLGVCSDRMGERRWHSASATFLGAAALYMSVWTTDHLMLMLFSMTCVLAFTSAASNVLLASCSDYLHENAAAGGLALISAASMLGSFAGPVVIGWSKMATGSFKTGLFAMASVLLLGGALILVNRVFMIRPQPHPSPTR